MDGQAKLRNNTKVFKAESPRLYVGPYKSEKVAEFVGDMAAKAFDAFQALCVRIPRATIISMPVGPNNYLSKPLPQGVDMSLRWVSFDFDAKPPGPKLQVIEGGAA